MSEHGSTTNSSREDGSSFDRTEYARRLWAREPAAWFPLVLGTVECQLREAASARTLTAARQAAMDGLDAIGALSEVRQRRWATLVEYTDAAAEKAAEMAAEMAAQTAPFEPAGAVDRESVVGDEPLW